MSLSYASELHTQDRFFFLRLLFYWTGSVWKLLWVDFLVFILAYILVAILYLNILYKSPQMRTAFEEVAIWLKAVRSAVPLSFMLGFFVSTVVARWWNVVLAIPFMSTPAFCCQTLLQSFDGTRAEVARKLRISILRYMNLSWILQMADMSLHLKERFGFFVYGNQKFLKTRKKLPWRQQLQQINCDSTVQKYFGNLITDEEMVAFAATSGNVTVNGDDFGYTLDYWLPLVWCSKLLRMAKNLNLIADERQYLYLVDQIRQFRDNLSTVWLYAEFNIPLVYTQLAVVAVYLFLASTIISSQLVPSDQLLFKTSGNHQRHAALLVMSYIPIAGGLEFVFYLGWFKIGICLLNSLGKDEADIPLSEILDFNLRISADFAALAPNQFPPGLKITDYSNCDEAVTKFLNSFNFDNVKTNGHYLVQDINRSHQNHQNHQNHH